MEGFSDVRFRQRAVIEFLTGEKVPPIEIHSKEMVSKTNHHFFKDGFQKLVQRWRKCIEVRGDFVEK